jgi:hypothetical protein
MIRNSSADIVTDRTVLFRHGQRLETSLHIVQIVSGAPPSLLSYGHRGLCPVVKRPRRNEANHLPPSSAEVNGGSVPLLSPHTFLHHAA